MLPGYLMAFDRPDDDFEAGEARLEQHLRNGGSRGDVPADRSEPAETRTREEYCVVLRAADGGSGDDSEGDDGPGDDPHVVDPRTDHSGWDSIDAANLPPLDAIRVSPQRVTHILEGDADG